MRTTFLVAGAVLLFMGAGIVLYQLSESCEDSALANANWMYPWCSDMLDHINLTFVGVLALFAGLVVLALGGTLHWILEPSKEEGPP
jgi:hypothetical protein